MTQIHQQLLETLTELETLRKSIEQVAELNLRLETEEQNLIVLEKGLNKEGRDVDILQHESVTSWFRKIIGDREEKLDKNREEYKLASQQHIELFKSIELIRFELNVLNKKNDMIESVENKVALLMQEREKELISADPNLAALIKNMNKERTELNHQLNRIINAIETGEKVTVIVMNIEEKLNEATTHWGSKQVGSGALAYEAIEGARHILQKANVVLLRFQKELKLVFEDLQLDTKIQLEDFGRYSGFIFHNMIGDFLFQEKIDTSLASVVQIRQNIEMMLTILDQNHGETVDKLAELEDKRKVIIISND